MCAGNDVFWCSEAAAGFVERKRLAVGMRPYFPQNRYVPHGTQRECSTWNTAGKAWGADALPATRMRSGRRRMRLVFHVEHPNWPNSSTANLAMGVSHCLISADAGSVPRGTSRVKFRKSRD